MDDDLLLRDDRATFKNRLARFFTKYNPSKLSQLDVIVDKYLNLQSTVFKTLVSKYGPEPPHEEHTVNQTAVVVMRSEKARRYPKEEQLFWESEYEFSIPGELDVAEVLMVVFSFLSASPTVLLRCSAVCTAWREHLMHAPQWGSVYRDTKTKYYIPPTLLLKPKSASTGASLPPATYFPTRESYIVYKRTQEEEERNMALSQAQTMAAALTTAVASRIAQKEEFEQVATKAFVLCLLTVVSGPRYPGMGWYPMFLCFIFMWPASGLRFNHRKFSYPAASLWLWMILFGFIIGPLGICFWGSSRYYDDFSSATPFTVYQQGTSSSATCAPYPTTLRNPPHYLDNGINGNPGNLDQWYSSPIDSAVTRQWFGGNETIDIVHAFEGIRYRDGTMTVARIFYPCLRQNSSGAVVIIGDPSLPPHRGRYRTSWPDTVVPPPPSLFHRYHQASELLWWKYHIVVISDIPEELGGSPAATFQEHFTIGVSLLCCGLAVFIALAALALFCGVHSVQAVTKEEGGRDVYRILFMLFLASVNPIWYLSLGIACYVTDGCIAGFPFDPVAVIVISSLAIPPMCMGWRWLCSTPIRV